MYVPYIFTYIDARAESDSLVWGLLRLTPIILVLAETALVQGPQTTARQSGRGRL